MNSALGEQCPCFMSRDITTKVQLANSTLVSTTFNFKTQTPDLTSSEIPTNSMNMSFVKCRYAVIG